MKKHFFLLLVFSIVSPTLQSAASNANVQIAETLVNALQKGDGDSLDAASLHGSLTECTYTSATHFIHIYGNPKDPQWRALARTLTTLLETARLENAQMLIFAEEGMSCDPGGFSEACELYAKLQKLLEPYTNAE